VFDVLEVNGVGLRPLPLLERKDWIRANLTPYVGSATLHSFSAVGDDLASETPLSHALRPAQHGVERRR
jgi:hypothetical protein